MKVEDHIKIQEATRISHRMVLVKRLGPIRQSRLVKADFALRAGSEYVNDKSLLMAANLVNRYRKLTK